MIIEDILVYELLYSVEEAGVVLASMGLGLDKGGVASIPALDALLPRPGGNSTGVDYSNKAIEQEKGIGDRERAEVDFSDVPSIHPSTFLNHENGGDKQQIFKRLESARRLGEQVITLKQFEEWAGYDNKVMLVSSNCIEVF